MGLVGHLSVWGRLLLSVASVQLVRVTRGLWHVPVATSPQYPTYLVRYSLQL